MHCYVCREFEKLKVVCEEHKTKYTELEFQATKAGEDLKHLANKVSSCQL